jgi:tRNA-specific adenosine deaminase 3
LPPDTSFQLPIVAHVPIPYNTKDRSHIAFTARDTRRSTAHPLRHAVLNVVRRIADYRASSASPKVELDASSSVGDVDGAKNGTNYLLTSMTLFTTHEPCVMCSMALLHSRVKEVIYLIPMQKTGGCGGLACLPTLEGVNHRFGICRWKTVAAGIDTLGLDESTDA